MKASLQTQQTRPAAVTPVPARSGLLQRKCACGGAPGFDGECASCRQKRLLGGNLQAKLRINQPGDPFEREADGVAEQMMRMPAPGLPHRSKKGEEEDLFQTRSVVQRRVGGDVGTQAEVPPVVHEVLRSPGQPLDPATRAFFEPRFGHDFSAVRIHTDASAAESARAVNALAYTVGRDVVFGAGQYAPGTGEGRRLLAHELTHVVQQSHVRASFQKLSLDSTSTGILEQEAQALARRVSSAPSLSVQQKATVSLVQRQRLVEEPAGGCGLCHGPRGAGSIAHRLIQEEFEILFPLGLVEFPISSPTDENGRLDLAIATPAGLEIGEIKPANAEGYAQGSGDLAFYFTALQGMFPGRNIDLLKRVLPSPVTIFPNPQVPSCPLQTLYVNPPVNGVYGYFCSPSYSQLVANPNCRCRGRREPVRVPARERAPAPAPAVDRRSALQAIRDFVRQVVESGENAEEAARRFLAEHPEVRYLLIGAAIAIVVATLAEDIATLGAGILDDPASLAAAWALVRVAQTAR